MKYINLLLFLCFKAIVIFAITSIIMRWPTDVFPDMIFSSLFILPFLFAALFVFVGFKDFENSIILYNLLYRVEIKHADIISVKSGKLNFIYPIAMRSFWVKCFNHYCRYIVVFGNFDPKIAHRLEQMTKIND